MKNRGISTPAITLIAVAIFIIAGVTYAEIEMKKGHYGDMNSMMVDDGTMMHDGKMMNPDGSMMTDEEMMKHDNMMMDDDANTMEEGIEANNMMDDMMMAHYTGKVLAGNGAPFLDFNKADYDLAVKSGKVIFLYFYANWCPICKAEIPNAYAAFNEFKSDKLIGFRVNYKDDATDSDETALANKYKITYQHTKVIVKKGVAKNYLDSWDKARFLKELTEAVK